MEPDARIIKFAGACLTWLCTLLAIAVAVLGVRSIWRCDEAAYCTWTPAKPDADFEGYDRRMVFGSYRGGLFFLRTKVKIPHFSDDFRELDLDSAEPAEVIFRSSADLKLAAAAVSMAYGSQFRPEPRWRWGGFNFRHDANWLPMGGNRYPGWVYTGIVAPHWAVLLALSWAPWTLVRRPLVVRRRRRLGLCLHCGYDLRASGDICSECGLSRTAAAAPGRASLLLRRLWRRRRAAAILGGGAVAAVAVIALACWWAQRPVRLGPEVRLSPNRLPRRVELNLGGATLRLARIPPGKFTMGPLDENPDWRNEENAPHEVIITKPFYMGLTPVTQEQFEAVMGYNRSENKEPKNPVQHVSWTEAMEFCRRVRQRTGQNVRLPTEAEWEYACRAGTSTRFNTGRTLPRDRANYDYGTDYPGNRAGNDERLLLPVASFKPNAWGLYDMHGGVAQWCSDWYGPYPSATVVDPAGPASGERRVQRGGCWWAGACDCRSAKRSSEQPDSAWIGDWDGFRIAMDP